MSNEVKDAPGEKEKERKKHTKNTFSYQICSYKVKQEYFISYYVIVMWLPEKHIFKN